MIKHFIKELVKHRQFVDQKVREAGIDPATIVLRARVRNLLTDIKHAFLCTVRGLSFEGVDEHQCGVYVRDGYRVVGL